MARYYYSLFFILFMLSVESTAQTTISGTAKDVQNGESLIGANISIKSTSVGAVSDEKGNYRFETTLKPPFTLSCSFIGYAQKEVLVTEGGQIAFNLELGQQVNITEEVVVSASRRAEKITQAPSTINIINAKTIEETPAFNIGELAARTKGVDYVRAGVLGTGLNVRGFNSAFNPKNLQLNDNRISSLVATGLPLGVLGTVVKEDIERVEIVLGPSSALYGPNANNGLVNTITKDPRVYQGTTVALGAGNQNVMTARLRHAQVLNDKFAFKVTGEYTKGTEFNYTDSVYIGSDPRTSVAKTEIDLDRDFNTLRGEAALYFSPDKGKDIILSYGGSNSNNVALTNAGRNQIKDWQVHYFQLRYTSPRFFAQAYYTMSRTDSTYAINQTTQNYWSYKNAGIEESIARAKMLKTQYFAPAKLDLARGALFQDKSNRLNAEAQYNNNFAGINLIAGVQFQSDDANSNGTYLLDNKGAGVIINQLGGYAQLERTFAEKFKVVLAARADNHDRYGFNFIPKGALVYLLPEGSIRLTYGQGIAAPTILNLDGNLFGGLLLGNGVGFTVRDYNITTKAVTETLIKPLEVEKLKTFEIGYKSAINKKLFIDVNAYYNTSENFLSPTINIGLNTDPNIKRTVSKRGDQLMSAIIPGVSDTGTTLVLTYLNFGKVNTSGFDVGLNYYFTNSFSAGLNYSYFNFKLDKTDKNNDGDRNGIVNDLDLPINTPKHKGSLALNYSGKKFFGSLFTRWVQTYDFFSGINVAAKSNPDIFTNLAAVPALGLPAQKYELKENARYGRNFNYGPLGGFVNVDLSLGYRINSKVTIAGQITNLLDNKKVREFIAAPYIGRLYQLELKLNLPAIKGKQ